MAIRSLQRAEKCFDGGRSGLAVVLGVSTSTVGMWHVRSNIPTEYLKPIEDATGVSVYELLADIEEAKADASPQEAS